jgi:hypothetical protein
VKIIDQLVDYSFHIPLFISNEEINQYIFVSFLVLLLIGVNIGVNIRLTLFQLSLDPLFPDTDAWVAKHKAIGGRLYKKI